MAERMIPVPESLIERAEEALLEVPPSSRNADIYGELHALLSQPTLSAEPCTWCEGAGYDTDGDAVAPTVGPCWKCRGTGQAALDVNSMASGTTFVEAMRWEVRRDSGGFTYALRDGTSRYPETFDPSTIRDVTPPPTTPEEEANRKARRLPNW